MNAPPLIRIHSAEKEKPKKDEAEDEEYEDDGFRRGCYIATCVYGSYDCPEVWTLRRYRDYTLAKTWHGRAFIRIYYAISPKLVRLFGRQNWFRNFCKPQLDRKVAKLRKQGFESSPYTDQDIIHGKN